MLNKAQQKAVDYDQGHLLIVAGPGTGKTHTLTHRIINHVSLLKEDQKICAITFTQKAAREMQERLARLLPESNFQRIFIGTFHQFCFKILQEHADHFPENMSIAGEEIVLDLTKQLWPELKVRERKQYLQRISQAKSDLNSKPFPEWEQYNLMLLKHGLLDYDDLLRETVLLFQERIEVLESVQNVFQYFFVDEYQDINAMQHAFLCCVIGPHNVLTGIGDPHQAIYAFRGARIAFFNRFIDDFDGARMFFLDKNYRSCPDLLQASSQVIAQDVAIDVPPLTAHLHDQGQLIIYAAPTDRAEAEYVVHQIERLVGGTSMFSHDSGRVDTDMEGEMTFGDIAILYRMNTQSRVLVEALERSGIPYGMAGKQKIEEDPYDLDAERVSLMTLHASKGLEFPVVFIVGCERGVLPLELENFDTNIMEERRLFYVGMTRAKKILYLVRSEKRSLYGISHEQRGPSPFIDDIEESLKCYEQAKIPRPRPDRFNQMEMF